MRLDSSGRLGLGTSVFGSGAGQGTGTVAQINGSLYVYEGNNSGNHGGAIAFGTSGTNASYTPMAQIKGLLTNAPGTEQQGDLAFYTRPTGSAGQTLTERLRITSGGAVGIGTTSPATTLDVSGPQAANVTAVAALDINCSLGNFFTKTINANSTFTVSNVPASRSYSFTLELTHTSGTVTWFTGVTWPNSTAPTLTTGKVHLFMFVTDDGGTTWRGSSLINY
jgi:hypothetical protein